VDSAALYPSTFSPFRYFQRCQEKVSRISPYVVPNAFDHKLTLFVVPGTLAWTKVKAFPETTWAKQPPKAVKGKAGSQAPNGRVSELT